MYPYGCEKNDHSFTVSCGVEGKPMQKKYERHFHEKNEMLLFISGDADYNIDGEQFSLKPYDLLFIPKTKYHFLVPKSDEKIYESVIFTFESSFSEKCEQLFSPPYIINIRDNEFLKQLFEHVKFCCSNYSKSDCLKAVMNAVRLMLINLSYIPKNKEAFGERGIVSEIISFIDHNIEAELDANVIAKHFNFSKSHVQNKFSTVMGIGLGQYIHHKKMYVADADIQNGMLPCEAAEKYGYSSYPSFYRQYIKTFGVSPVKRKK